MWQRRRDMVTLGLFLLSFAGTGTAAADDGVESMLDAIPEIEAPAAVEDPEKKKPQAEEAFDLDAYFEQCRAAVYPHFKMPKKIAKKAPGVEISFLVSIDAEGTILGVSAPKRSGFKAWDAAALAALNKVGQLPPPPPFWNPTLNKVLIPFNADSK